MLRTDWVPHVDAVPLHRANALLTGAFACLPHKFLVLMPSGAGLLGLERQPTLHMPFARNFRTLLTSVDRQFDVCVIDAHPNPDIRLIAVLPSADMTP